MVLLCGREVRKIFSNNNDTKRVQKIYLMAEFGIITIWNTFLPTRPQGNIVFAILTENKSMNNNYF